MNLKAFSSYLAEFEQYNDIGLSGLKMNIHVSLCPRLSSIVRVIMQGGSKICITANKILLQQTGMPLADLFAH